MTLVAVDHVIAAPVFVFTCVCAYCDSDYYVIVIICVCDCHVITRNVFVFKCVCVYHVFRLSLEVPYSGDPSTLVSLIEFESSHEKKMPLAKKIK